MGKKGSKGETDKHAVVCVCGLAGSGKSTLAKKIADRYGLRYFSGGDALKALAMEDGYKNIERGWWESAEGMRFLEKRGKDHALDKAIDNKLLELAQQGRVILDSWTMPWLIAEGFKIWLEASPEKRSRRIAKRDKITSKEASEALVSKERHTKEIYKKLYGFNLGEDFKPFHLILDTNNLKADEVFQVICMVLDKCLVKHEEGLDA